MNSRILFLQMKEGLFLHLLLPEFHFYGECINTLTSAAEFETETNGIFHWFKSCFSSLMKEQT